MSVLLDSSVLVAALFGDDDHHVECLALLTQGDCVVYAHAFLETFSTLTGGRLGVKVDADLAAKLVSETVRPRVRVVELSGEELLSALRLARKQGVSGGGVYDFTHFIAAKKAEVTAIYTLNTSDFQHLRREGDPEIRRP